MKALITGASSGIGMDMAKVLSGMGYDLVLVARRRENLEKLKSELNTDTVVIPMDLSDTENCFKLYEMTKGENIEILINNAGYGIYGTFDETDLDSELNMIDLNIKALHVLTKLFYKDFKKRNSGYILNVASSAAFTAGPLLSSYYASKAYVLRLTHALYEELRQDKIRVYVGALCPGPVETEFSDRAGADFAIKGLRSEFVAKYAISKMFKRKLTIVPGIGIKLLVFIQRLVSYKLQLFITYYIQKRKGKKEV